MANFGASSVSILVSIIFMSIAPLSTANKVTDSEIKHLCSKTSNSMVCYKILKSDHRIANADEKGLAEVSVDIASSKAREILSQLNSYAKATHDSKLRNVYESCSKHYGGAIRDLEAAKTDLHSRDYANIRGRVKDASEEINSCERVFYGVSSDHAHIRKTNEEFEFLLSLVKVTSDNLKK